MSEDYSYQDARGEVAYGSGGVSVASAVPAPVDMEAYEDWLLDIGEECAEAVWDFSYDWEADARDCSDAFDTYGPPPMDDIDIMVEEEPGECWTSPDGTEVTCISRPSPSEEPAGMASMYSEAFPDDETFNEIEIQAEGDWIGWSVDGVNWGWQLATDAFGYDFDSGGPLPQVAVGRDFVVLITPDARMFVAAIP